MSAGVRVPETVVKNCGYIWGYPDLPNSCFPCLIKTFGEFFESSPGTMTTLLPIPLPGESFAPGLSVASIVAMNGKCAKGD